MAAARWMQSDRYPAQQRTMWQACVRSPLVQRSCLQERDMQERVNWHNDTLKFGKTAC
jgi:hypothetical protein